MTTEPVLFVPSQSDVDSLKVGDLALDAFGNWAPVVEISYRGVDIHGFSFVGYYTKLGDSGGSMSHSYKVNELVATVHVTSVYKTSANARAEYDRRMSKPYERKTCMLPMMLRLALLSDKQSPCAGCDGDRTVCNGEPKSS